MSEMTIEVHERESVGSGGSRRLRAQELIPAVLYGGGRETRSIQVDRKSFLDLLKSGSAESKIFLLKQAGTGKERHAMIRDLQIDPVSRKVIHVDFQRVSMDEKLRVQVPVELNGTPVGVKTEGGMLDFVTRELHIECLPRDIPKAIEVDVSPLHIGQHIEARDLHLPAGVALLDEPGRLIVSISHTKAEVAAAEGEAAAQPEPEVVKPRGKGEES